VFCFNKSDARLKISLITYKFGVTNAAKISGNISCPVHSLNENMSIGYSFFKISWFSGCIDVSAYISISNFPETLSLNLAR